MKLFLAVLGIPAVLVTSLIVVAGVFVVTLDADAAATCEDDSYLVVTSDGWTQPFPSGYYITSPFGIRRHPITGRTRMHAGIDLVGKGSKTVIAANAGKVVSAGRLGGYGNQVLIDHGGGITTRYAHLRTISAKKGQRVSAGSKVGIEGSTGNSTGPHLHFEVRRNGKAINPKSFMLKAGAPLNGRNRGSVSSSDIPEEVSCSEPTPTPTVTIGTDRA